MNATTRLVTLLAAVSWVAGCASTPSSSSSSSPSLPSPTSSPSPMPSLPSPTSSPSARPSLPSPSAPSSSRSSSSSSSSSSGNPGQTGAPTPGATPGATASQPGGAQADAPTSTGGQNDLEVLEPEPPEDLADADPTWDEGDAAAGSEGDGGAAGGGASGGPEGGGQPGAEGDVEVVVSPADPDDGGGLDQQLNRSLEVFDLEMQRTITILASARGGEGDSGSGGMDARSGEEDPVDQTGGGSELILVDGDPSLLPGGENSGEPVDGEGGTEVASAGNRSGMRGGSTRNEAYPRIPPDVGDGSDDDVVARQIREAALNESDPVLREKLWQEYRNYKKSIK